MTDYDHSYCSNNEPSSSSNSNNRIIDTNNNNENSSSQQHHTSDNNESSFYLDYDNNNRDHNNDNNDTSSDYNDNNYYLDPLVRRAISILPICLRFNYYKDDTITTDNNNTDDDDDDVIIIEQQQLIPIEVHGLALDTYARAPIGMSSLFLGPALLDLASYAAGCNVNDNDESIVCENTIHGFRPSSLLTNLATISGILGCIFLPLFGSIVDHTKYRKQIGTYTAYGITIVKGIEIIVGQKTWFIVANLQIISSIIFYLHITASYAYISELSINSNEQATYNAGFSIISYVSTTIFLIAVMSLSVLFVDNDDIGTAKISQLITVCIAAPYFYYAWTYLFRNRPALSQLPSSSSSSSHNTSLSLAMAGFQKVINTIKRIRHQYHSLQYLMIAIAFGEAASAALVSVSTTYLKNVLNMNANEIGIVFLAVLLAGVPGSKLGGILTNKLHNPISSIVLGNALFISITSLAAVVLRGPNEKKLAWIFGIAWGVALGWVSPQHTAAYIPVIPRGQQAELMGIYLLCTMCLSWLPPLVFTILNEFGMPMSWGLASLNIFFGLEILCLYGMGDYHLAVAAVQPLPTTDEIDDDNNDFDDISNNDNAMHLVPDSESTVPISSVPSSLHKRRPSLDCELL